MRAWGQLKRGFEVLALGEICFEGMGAVEKGVKCVLRTWGQLKRGFEVPSKHISTSANTSTPFSTPYGLSNEATILRTHQSKLK